MPYPAPQEKRSMYLKRAIPEIKGEGTTVKQAIGKAEGMYDTYSGGKNPENGSPAAGRKQMSSIFTRMGAGKPKSST